MTSPPRIWRASRAASRTSTPGAVNPAGPYDGLFSSLRSTWATTPETGDDIFDLVASASAAWMWQQGRRHEWACR